MGRFQPLDDLKPKVVHDASKKLHVKFDDDDTKTPSTPPTKGVKRKSTSDSTAVKKQKKDTPPNDKKPFQKKNGFKKDAAKRSSDKKLKDKVSKKPVVKKDTKAKPISKRAAEIAEKRLQEKIQRIRRKKNDKRLAKKHNKDPAPELHLRPESIEKKLITPDIQNFVRYILDDVADNRIPSWIQITQRSQVKHVALVNAQGLDIGDFGAPADRGATKTIDLKQMPADTTAKQTMPFLTTAFSHLFIYKIPGHRGVINSVVKEMLQVPLSSTQMAKQGSSDKEAFARLKDEEKPMYFTLTLEQMRTNGYPIPTCLDATVTLADGWKETKPAETENKVKTLMGLDCEMVQTASGSALARVSLISEDGKTLLDEIVKPAEEITDYLTQYSGITPELMKGKTISLRRAQKYLRRHVNHNVILVGHSLENDLKALKITHPLVGDTSLLYDHWRGPPFKPALRVLTQHLLKRTIQNHGKEGHDSAEDAIASMDLFRLKIKHGPQFGRIAFESELLFDRLKKARTSCTSALLECADIKDKGGKFRSGDNASYTRCRTNDELVEKSAQAIQERNFVFSSFSPVGSHVDKRMPESAIPQVVPENARKDASQQSLARFDEQIKRFYDACPPHTVFIVLGGRGYIPEYERLLELYKATHDIHGNLVTNAQGAVWTPKNEKQLATYNAQARLTGMLVTIKK